MKACAGHLPYSSVRSIRKLKFDIKSIMDHVRNSILAPAYGTVSLSSDLLVPSNYMDMNSGNKMDFKFRIVMQKGGCFIVCL